MRLSNVEYMQYLYSMSFFFNANPKKPNLIIGFNNVNSLFPNEKYAYKNYYKKKKK